MIQLIITVVSIALTAALLLASINYIPWWHGIASDTEFIIKESLPKLERAYNVATILGNGTPPAPTTEADGGFQSLFEPIVKLLPAAPPGFEWSYGRYTGTEQPWAGLDYFCLTYTASGGRAEQGAWTGALRASTIFSPQQYILGSACGKTVSQSLPSSYPQPLAITFFVAYVPGVSTP